MATLIVITDLDGTLLDHENYSFGGAAPALDVIRDLQIPLVIVTSKTRAEVSRLRARLNVPGPDIVENGSWSRDYGWICSALEETAAETGVTVRGFHNMTPEEISEISGLPSDVATLAAQREFSEPFSILDEAQAPELVAALEKKGLQWTRGGRFYHVFERGGKAAAVAELLRQYPDSTSVGLGDAPNDIGFLQLVDYPVIVNSPRACELIAAVPKASVTRQPAPEGWSEVLLPLLRRLRPPAYRP
jgi:mannosyl-3-phosphoglycerate phosphatase